MRWTNPVTREQFCHPVLLEDAFDKPEHLERLRILTNCFRLILRLPKGTYRIVWYLIRTSSVGPE